MKNLSTTLIICLFSFLSYSQTRQGGILSQEYSKDITEYYSKQFIVDEVLKVQDRQPVEVYIDAITAAKSGELTTVLYECSSLQKEGIVFAFWNDYSTGIILPYKGYGFYNLDLEEAKELFNNLESLINNKNKFLSYTNGNLVYKSNDLTYLFYNKSGDFGYTKSIRVWWKTFDSDWTITNLETTIKRFKKFFDLEK